MTLHRFGAHDGRTFLHEAGFLPPDLRATGQRPIELFRALVGSDVARLLLGGDWRMDVADDRGGVPLQLVLQVRRPYGPLGVKETAT